MTRFWNNLHQVRNVTSLGADESKGTNRIAQIGHAHSIDKASVVVMFLFTYTMYIDLIYIP
jgi:hypothetical protein